MKPEPECTRPLAGTDGRRCYFCGRPLVWDTDGRRPVLVHAWQPEEPRNGKR